MTTTIKAGTGRPAAQAKRERHAQRDRKASTRTPVATPERAAQPAAGAGKRAPRVSEATAGLRAASTGAEKAKITAALLRERGWTVKTKAAALSASLAGATLHLEWGETGSWRYDSSAYTRNGRTRKVLNVSAALKLA